MQIVIIDDHQMFTDAVALTLQQKLENCYVQGFTKVAEAARHFAKNHYADLLIVDINLPGGSGLDLLKHYRTSNLVGAMIVCSGETTLGLPQQCQALGANGFWAKSGSVDDFVLLVKKVLSGGMLASDGFDQGLQWGVSKRQMSVLQLLVEGLSYREIAETLFVSENTVKTHVRLLYQQLDANNRTSCIAKAKALGLLH